MTFTDESARDQANRLVPDAMAVAADGVGTSHAGMQLYVSQHGSAVTEAAVGWSTGDTPMTPRTMLPWFCCIKPLFAIAFARLWEEGEVALHQPVSDVIGEFTGGGKDQITFWHLLTHTAGLRPDPFYTAIWEPREDVLDAICAADLPVTARPGSEAYYAQFWAWTILSEAISRRSGMAHETFIATQVLDPLGIIDFRLPVGDAEWERDGHRIGPIYDTESDLAPRLFVATEHRWQFGAYGPGAVGVGSAGALGRVAEAFLPEPPVPVLRPQTVEAMCARHRVGFWDEHWGSYLNWGLGVIADGWLFGAHCPPNTVGHIGYNTSFFSVDRTNNVVVAGIANGLADMATSAGRDRGITDAVYRNLKLPARDEPAPRVVAVDPPVDHDTSQDARAEARYWKPSVGMAGTR